MKPTFEKTVDILVKAYLNDTLEHGNCYACAVGNMVAAANGYTYNRDDFSLKWSNERMPVWIDPVWLGYVDRHHRSFERAKSEAESTGYTIDEIARIEEAFEYADRHGQDRDGYNGLMAVVSVLAEIHGVSLEEKERAQMLFVK
jgi:hypothetical protein